MYIVETFAMDGRRTGIIGKFANIQSARQAMLDHAGLVDLPDEISFQCPMSGFVEGWFAKDTEYNITICNNS